MTLRFRHLRLRAETGDGRFGADFPLSSGLMILRAENSRGKSTAVQSILFALGLERMIAAKPANAVTSAMRDRLIFDEATKRETPVLSSWVSLEIENGDGAVATVTRWVKDDRVDTGLVRVTHGPFLTESGSYETGDFYVGRSGAAQNPRGFHKWLSEFIGWEMPQLPTSDGRLAPLYMEQVFPLLFVEQRRGWGGIQAQMPYFSGVSNVRQRAIEFLLNLDVGKLESRRQELRARETQLHAEWRRVVTAFKDGLAGQGLAALRLPDELTVTWPPDQPPTIAESRGDAWLELGELTREAAIELVELERTELPRVQADAADAEERLSKALSDVDTLREASAAVREGILRDQAEVNGVRARLAALREDLREHQDVLTLHRLGSAEIDRLHGDCPVCHQQLPSSLLGGPAAAITLSPEDTVTYIRQQIELFEAMERDSLRALEAKQERWSAIRSAEAEQRSQVRAIRASLTSANGTPSEEIITRRVRLKERLERLSLVQERFAGLRGELNRLAEDARSVRSALAQLPTNRLSDEDEVKLRLLEHNFTEQLHAYDFGSFSDERLRISREDYLPRREQFDLQADISASDSIRVVWSYLLGLLEVSDRTPTNHPRVLVFDEPRQQSTKDVSFEALLRRAGSAEDGRQVIFATSEDLEHLRQMLEGVAHSLVAVDGYVLKPVSG